jgi:glycosyltransferase involved in cell wall biosynthesis
LKKSEHLIHKNRKNLEFNGYFDRNFKKLYTILDQNKIQPNRVLLSIVLPVYNEENTVRRVLSSLPKCDSVEIVVVDDHSTDKSLEEIKTLREDLNLKLIRHSKNEGYGKALLTGIANSTGRIILTMDSDGQHLPEDIFNLVEPILTKKADITIGSRYVGTYNYKLPVSTRFEDFAFTTELLLKAALSKFKIKEAPIHLLDREYDSSKINLPPLILHLMLCILYYTIQWVNRPYVNKWMIKRLIFLKKLPIYGKPKRIQDVTTRADKMISIA